MDEELTSWAETARAATLGQPPPPSLEGFIAELATSGGPYNPWAQLKELIAGKAIAVVDSYNTKLGYHGRNDRRGFEQRKTELVERIRYFQEAPFTLQRIAEILHKPEPCYGATHKLLNGLEKLLSVSTTVPIEDRQRAREKAAAAAAAAAADQTVETMEIGSDGEDDENPGPQPLPPAPPAQPTDAAEMAVDSAVQGSSESAAAGQ